MHMYILHLTMCVLAILDYFTFDIVIFLLPFEKWLVLLHVQCIFF